MRVTNWIGSAAALTAMLLLAGCGATKIAYKPMDGSAPAAAKSVALQVTDERPADKGGSEKAQVGQVRGSYGIPSAVKDSSPTVATTTVTDAVTDALKQAGVSVQAGAKETLVAAVQHYWMDGMAGYKATVTVKYTLQDASGKALWTKDVSGGAGGALIFKSAESMAQDMFANALTDMAKKSSEDFKSSAFQTAVK